MSVAEAREFAETSIEEIDVEAVPLCDLCGGASREPFAGGRDFELRTCRNEWTFVRCRSCGHVWLDPRPSIDSLTTIYPRSYYAYSYEAIPWIARTGKAMLDRRKIGAIMREVSRPVESYVDIGCGTGRYLRVMAARGTARSAIHGLELDAATVAQLRREGFQAHHARVETCDQIPANSIDLATMFHVIEHVASPAVVLDRIANWLVPGGILALETPNIESFDARRFRDRWWGGYHFPRHWHLFSAETLQDLLRRHGFEPVAVRYQTGHSFWMYSLHHRLRYGSGGHPGIARWFDPMKSVIPLAGFTAFDLARAAAGARTSAMLILARRIKARGGKLT